ncbi:MAG: aminobutyraldehyde dehydrogenase [Synechococcaceae cyanobacterium SM2_3_1]|nr:aminobutyraldehyde dehydrogenase [Synechococcaceae cyanobacterium SM2_3_1]
MEHKLWIGGEWQESQKGERMPVINPATGSELAMVSKAAPEDVDRAVRQADASFKAGVWSRLTPGERSQTLWRWADLIEAESDSLAHLESENTGKPYQLVSRAEDLPFAVDNLRFFAAAARDIQGFSAGEYTQGYTSLLRRDPVGVVGQITPWNYPLVMAIWKAAPALAAGCSVVLKPAPGTPLTTLTAGRELSAEAGIPGRVFNVVNGGNTTGAALVDHSLVRMISLTGSTATGQRVMHSAATTLKRVQLELGGKAPLLVMEDADVETVAEKAAWAATYNSGQDCTAATRVYVPHAMKDSMQEALVSAMNAIQVGRPFDKEVEMGPLISATQQERVQGFVDRARAAGAKILTGGGPCPDFPDGYFFQPTLITEADQHSEILQQEVFGPVLTLSSYGSEAEAIHLANDVPYGLAASLWTHDLERALRISREMEFGTVWVNDHLVLCSETPHGGSKHSGFGKDLSLESMREYQMTRHIMIATP